MTTIQSMEDLFSEIVYAAIAWRKSQIDHEYSAVSDYPDVRQRFDAMQASLRWLGELVDELDKRQQRHRDVESKGDGQS